MQRYCLARINMKRAIVSICPLLAIMIPVSYAGSQTVSTGSAATNTQGPSAETASALHLLDKLAPAFTVVALDGKEVSLADYKRKALLVNFWATWCGACRLEMPWLGQLREQYASQGFEIIGIVTDGATDDKVRQIAAKYGVEYRIARCNHKTAQAYGGLPYLPESFYIDKHGKVVLAAAEGGSKEEIEGNIRKLLGLKVK